MLFPAIANLLKFLPQEESDDQGKQRETFWKPLGHREPRTAGISSAG
jgi:hypothetical protein